MWPYCRSRFLLHACWGIPDLLPVASLVPLVGVGATSFGAPALAAIGAATLRDRVGPKPGFA